jgi:hypothetical protein
VSGSLNKRKGLIKKENWMEGGEKVAFSGGGRSKKKCQN